VVDECVEAQMFTDGYADVLAGDANWQGMQVPESGTFDWSDTSTYVRHPPYFNGMPREPQPVRDITGARVLALLGVPSRPTTSPPPARLRPTPPPVATSASTAWLRATSTPTARAAVITT